MRELNSDKRKAPIRVMRAEALGWLREPDLNRRPSGYEPDELPNCSIPRYILFYSFIIISLIYVFVNCL